jgi:hypothetical protein
MKASELMRQLAFIVDTSGDLEVVVPSYIDNRYEGLAKISTVRLLKHKGEGGQTRYGAVWVSDPCSPIVDVILLKL